MIRFLQTPGKVKKYVLGGLLLIVCVSMVTYLIPGGGIMGDLFGLGLSTAGVLAKVGAQEVTVAEVQKTADQLIRRQFPRGVPEQLRDIMRPQAMQVAARELIQRRALENEADRMGFRVSDQELAEFLQRAYGGALFRDGAPVSPAEYQTFIQQNFNMSVPEFESRLRSELLVNKLQAVVEGSATVSNADLEAEYKQQNTKVKFDYAVLSVDQIQKSIKPTDAELKAYFDSHQAQFQNSIPEKRKVQFVLIDLARLTKEIPVTPEDVQRYYNAHQEQYRVPDRVNVRQIQINNPAPGPDGKVDQKAVDAAKAKAEEVLKKLKAGGNFEQLAKQYSQDSASKDKGGSLGWLTRGQTDQEFEKVAFSLPKGGTSDVIKDSVGLGFHIIHVDDKQVAHLKPLEEVKPEIENVLRQERVANLAQSIATKIETQAKAAGLEKAAAQNGQQVITTGLISRTEQLPEIGSAPDLMSAIFDMERTAPPASAQMPKGWVVYQVTEVKPPATPTFEEAKAQVETQFKNERAGQLLQQKTQELADRAHAEHNLKKAAAELGATVKTSSLVSPSDQVPDVGSMGGQASVAFTMKPGDISGPINSGRNGVVLSLLEKQEPSLAEFDKAKDQLREQLLDRKRTEVMQIFAANLRARLEKEKKIRINQQEWDRITAPAGS